MTHTHKKTVKKIVDTIVESSNPEKIILFGSRARGDNKANSDYDFIVVKQGVKNERKVSRRIYKALFDNKIGVPVDIIVIDADKLEKNGNKPYMVYSTALREGEILYG